MTAPYFRKSAIPALLITASALAGCAHASAKPPAISFDSASPAVQASDPPSPIVIAVPTPLPLPGQLKPVGETEPRHDEPDPKMRVGKANAAARVQPLRDGFINAIQQYPWSDGALYQLYA
ncbi:MAG: P-type conjugative transfer protein TrbG, partial [Sphingomonas sp.]